MRRTDLVGLVPRTHSCLFPCTRAMWPQASTLIPTMAQAMDTEFDFGGAAAAAGAPSSVEEMAGVVESVLKEADVANKRPSQLDIPDFVR